MNLYINQQLFIVGGASSGLGKAVAEALLQEGARVIGIARGMDGLQVMQSIHGAAFELLQADMSATGSVEALLKVIDGRVVHGVLLNAGGPPAKTILETSLEDWDNAYRLLLRWKVQLVQALLPGMQQQGYGRLLFVESASVKQPLENLVLSNSLRLAVAGFAKTLSNEMAAHGITTNVMAPGFHNTAAMDRLFKKKQETTGMSIDAAKQGYAAQTKTGVLGEATDFGSLAAWLLSPGSRYITGQTISVDGGLVQGVFG